MSLVGARDGVEIVDAKGVLSWAEADDLLNRAVHALLAADVGPRRRVAVFAENSAETALAHVAGLLAGASTVPVNFHLTADEAAYILSDSGAQLLFVGPENLEVGAKAAAQAGLPTVVAWRAPARPFDGVIAWEDWLAAADPSEPPTDLPPSPSLMYTSGTTGRPKGVEQPPPMFAGGTSMSEHVERLRENRFAELGMHLVAGPLYHTGPLSAVRLLACGVPVSIPARFDAEAVLASIERDRVETSVMVPTHFARLLALPEAVKARYDVSSLRLVAHTGSACPGEVKRAMIDWWGPIFVEAYGATEVGTVCQITSAEWLERPGSVGRCVPEFEALVVDDTGASPPPGAEGRLYFRDRSGRGIVYHNDPAKSAAAHLAPGVFTLGEIGYVDDDGYVFVTDRFSDMVVSGGVNLYPAEAEAVLMQHPKVADVAVIGVPHEEMGEELKALVVAVDPADPPAEADVIAFCRERLTAMKCPRSVEIIGTVGRTAMGKVDKRALRAPYWERTA